MKKKFKELRDASSKNIVLNAAAKAAARVAKPSKAKDEMVKAGIDAPAAKQLVNEVLELTEQDFLAHVGKRLRVMVEDTLSTFHDKIQDIPPQNLPYALDILLKNSLTIAGRPSNITASANVKLGSSDITPKEARSILKDFSKGSKDTKKAEVISVEGEEGEGGL